MTDHPSEPAMTLEARDPHALLQGFVERLGEHLGATPAWEGGATVTPWQATAATFAELPERAAAAMLEVADATGERIVDLELGGMLQTDSGPRAWGTVATAAGAAQSMRVGHVSVIESDTGWRLEARLERGGADG